MMNNINMILIKVCEKLNLSESLYEKLKERYQKISEYLQTHPELNDVKIYPQGSISIGTTVKPISQDEYDLDFVCEKDGLNPFHLFTIIKEYLKNNGHYSELVEEKKRCVRLNYKEKFHIDILPACSDKESLSQTGTSILIPDKELRSLLPSDPKGYSAWFWKKSKEVYKRDAEIEALPQYQQASQKNYLQCIVQLMKRHRDIFFQHKQEHSPPSIIITTLCGNYYTSQRSIPDGLTNIVNTIKINPTPKVYNPINSEELLSEKWEENPILYNSFRTWIDSLYTDLQSLKDANNIEEKLKEMFGEKIVNPILDELKKRSLIHTNRKNLSVTSTGILSSTQNENNTPVRQNTFYGIEED
ncbi:MAG: nucleotidyltransferase [Bdellovibrionales bacterium]|nr:nucleotidyltransferase [Bdellovibrionales bacterium]